MGNVPQERAVLPAGRGQVRDPGARLVRLSFAAITWLQHRKLRPLEQRPGRNRSRVSRRTGIDIASTSSAAKRVPTIGQVVFSSGVIVRQYSVGMEPVAPKARQEYPIVA